MFPYLEKSSQLFIFSIGEFNPLYPLYPLYESRGVMT